MSVYYTYILLKVYGILKLSNALRSARYSKNVSKAFINIFQSYYFHLKDILKHKSVLQKKIFYVKTLTDIFFR